MDEQKPLGLKELSDVESPDVMRAALADFRRRTLLRGTGLVLLLVALPFFLRGVFSEQISNADALARAEQHEIGKVYEGKRSTLIVLDARKVRDEEVRRLVPPSYQDGRLLRMVATTKDITRGEMLEVAINSAGASGGGPDEPPWPPITVREVLVDFPAGVDEVTVFLLAVTGRVGLEEVGPGTHSRRQCAVPLNSLGVCELLRTEGRVIETFTLRFSELGIPREIWGVKADVAPGEPPGPPIVPRAP